MSVDTSYVGHCAVCDRPMIADEPRVAVNEEGFYADYADTGLEAHSSCGKQPPPGAVVLSHEQWGRIELALEWWRKDAPTYPDLSEDIAAVESLRDQLRSLRPAS